MTKLLISAGCSFTQFPGRHKTWPYHLSQAMGIEVLYLGQSAGSNGIISKKTIFHTLEALKNHDPKDILVGIMWSGSHRNEFYFHEDNTESHKFGYVDNDCNPVRIVSDSSYYLINDHWDDRLSTNFYKHYYDDVGSVISTIEHILNVQWFLKSHGVSYFMTKYFMDVFNSHLKIRYSNPKAIDDHIDIIDHPDVKYLYDLIDFDNWIDAEDCQSWVMKYSGLPFPIEGDPHPGTAQHKIYTEQVIIPFLKRKNLWQQNEINKP